MAMTPPQPGQLELYDNFVPTSAGTYTMTLRHDVAVSGASIAPVTQVFEVSGPRFTLDPADVHAQFPPPGSTGAFTESLPHIALTKRVLPWEREVPLLPRSSPWLALLVFGEGELVGDRGTGDFARTIAVGALPGRTSAIRGPDLLEVTATQAASACRTITMASSLFAAIVPTAAEAALLAHVRVVPAVASPVVDTLDQGQFSMVVANRFPRPGDDQQAADAIVHLVSLEGFGDLIGGSAPMVPEQDQVQMVSLASWTFSCLEDPAQTFTGLAANLVADAGTPRPAESLLLRLPGVVTPPVGSTDLASQAQRRLAEGYLALDYHARTGEDAFAWYRGPFAPVVPAPVPTTGPFTSADAAIQFDETTGLFDHSLAAAFEAGRSLALASEAFATALMRVRHAALAAALDPGGAASGIHEELASLLGSGLVEAVAAASADGVDHPQPSSRPNAPHPIAARRAALATAEIGLDAVDPGDLATVTTWLGQLLLLRPLPFVHLVPDARMLPAESIRAFYLDPAWIGALADGALSIGVGTSLDLAVQAALTAQIKAAAAELARADRAAATGQPVPTPATGPTTGFLLRSAMASGWPGLTVSGTAGTAAVPLLRLDHLSPGVLLCLFDGVPDTITLEEPHEGLQLGVNDTKIVVRSIVAPVGEPLATPIVYDPAGAGTGALRGGELRVLDVTGALLGIIAGGLGVDRGSLGPADVALQMLKVPEQVSFSPEGPT